MADLKSLEQEIVQLRNQLQEKDKEIEKLKEIRGMTLVLLFSPCHQS